MNLKIVSSDLDYGSAKSCTVVLDITDIKQTDDKDIIEAIKNSNAPENERITTAKILEQVVIAMEKNLVASGYKNSCEFSIKGMENHPQIKKNIQANSPLLQTKLTIKEK